MNLVNKKGEIGKVGYSGSLRRIASLSWRSAQGPSKT